MARGRLFPDEHDSELIIADGGKVLPAYDVAPGFEVTFARELEPDALPFRANRIDVLEPECWEIVQLTIGRVPQMMGRAPAQMFGPFSPALFLETLLPGCRVELRAINVSDKPRRLFARLLGDSIIPRPGGKLEAEIARAMRSGRRGSA